MKLNRIGLMVALLIAPLCMNAQNTKLFKYQGEVDAMYSFGLDDETNNINIEIVNGVRFSRYFYAGVGIGATANFSDDAVLVPIYLDVKGFLPVTNKMDLVAGLDLGTKLDYFYGTSGGLMLRPEFGLHFPFTEKSGLKLSLFYELYSYSIPILDKRIHDKTNSFGLKLGFCF